MKSRVDRVWDAFWSGGIANPLEVIEQITYLLFLRRLDEMQTIAELKAQVSGTSIENPLFLPGQDHLRWSRFKNADPEVMFALLSGEVFPFLRNLGQQVGGDRIIRLMVDLAAPSPTDEICDPACGTAGSWWRLPSTSGSSTPGR